MLSRLAGSILFLSLCFLQIPQAYANRVWAEYGLATATAGYDAGNNRTLIDKYYLGAVGPDSVADAVRDFVIDCAKKSTLAGAAAFKATPSPEIAARTAAATASFKAVFTGCVSTSGAAKYLASQFYISFDRKAYWETGLNLKFNAQNPSTEAYTVIHNAIKDKIPDPLNRAIVLYIAAMQPPQVNVKLEMPDEARRFLRVMPTPPLMNRYAQEAQLRAVNKGMQLIPEVLNEPKNLPAALGTYALNSGKDVIAAQIQIAQQLSSDAVQAANQGIQAVNQLHDKTSVQIPGTSISPIPKVPTSPQDLVPKSVPDAIKKAVCPFC